MALSLTAAATQSVPSRTCEIYAEQSSELVHQHMEQQCTASASDRSKAPAGSNRACLHRLQVYSDHLCRPVACCLVSVVGRSAGLSAHALQSAGWLNKPVLLSLCLAE